MEITSLPLFLLGLIILPPFFSIIILLVRMLSLSIISIYRFPARSHATWLPDSPFLLQDHGCVAEGVLVQDRVSPPYVAELGIVRYKPAAASSTAEERVVDCAFCLCDIEEGQEIRELRCEHLFHRDCLDRWWLHHRRRTCPLCRKCLLP